MKKISMSFLCIMLLCILFMPDKVHAESIQTEGGTQVTITKNVASSYTVDIPKKIDLGNKTSASFTVSVQGNIAPTETLQVKTASQINMIRNGDDAYSNKASVDFGTHVWIGSDIEELAEVDGTITFHETKAGNYTGSVHFDIGLIQQ